LEKQVVEKQADQIVQHDQHVKHRSFSTGQKVTAKNFRPGIAWVVAKIEKQLGPLSYLVRIQSNLVWKQVWDLNTPINVSRIKNLKDILENCTVTVHMHMYESVQNGQLPSDTTTTMYNAALRATCGCVAHTSDLKCVKELIDVETPVNEYSGGIIATYLLQRVLGSIKSNITIEKCSQGSIA